MGLELSRKLVGSVLRAAPGKVLCSVMTRPDEILHRIIKTDLVMVK